MAVDLMGLGYSEITPTQDISFTAQARMLAQVIDALGIERVDLIGNDSDGAIAQIFAAHHPDRLTSFVLTNCDVHDGWPPQQVLPLLQHARAGTLVPIFQPLMDRPDLARERHANGEQVPLFRSYADPSVLTDEVIRLYLQPLLSSPQRIAAFQRYWLGFNNTQTVAIQAALQTLQVPTLIVWALQDFFFDKKWPIGCATRSLEHGRSSKLMTPDCSSRRIGRQPRSTAVAVLGRVGVAVGGHFARCSSASHATCAAARYSLSDLGPLTNVLPRR